MVSGLARCSCPVGEETCTIGIFPAIMEAAETAGAFVVLGVLGTVSVLGCSGLRGSGGMSGFVKIGIDLALR
jgi:hypothetical protein